MTAETIDTATFGREWAAWHRQHETVRADPHGFLAITGLHWLAPDPQRFPDTPGAWSTGPDGVTVTLGDAEDLVVDGVPVRGTYEFGIIPERGGINAAAGGAVIEVARRGGHNIVRPRHPDYPLRVNYRDPPASLTRAGVVTGRYVAFDQPRDVTVGAAVEGLQHIYTAPGV